MSPLCLRSHLLDGHKSTYFNSLVVRMNSNEIILRKKQCLIHCGTSHVVPIIMMLQLYFPADTKTARYFFSTSKNTYFLN